METGLCPLCKKTKKIADSHFIPKAVLSRLGREHDCINPEFLGFSDRQIRTPLLCFDCEDILNKGGEAWRMPLLAEYDGKFRLPSDLLRDS